MLAVALVAGEEPFPFPDMAPSVGALLAEHYYDPGRFHPRLMVERALRAVEQAEIGIEATWADGVILLDVQGECSRVPAPDPAGLAEAMRLIEAVRGEIERADFTPQHRRDLAYALVNGALRSLDPHTVLMPPENAADFGEDIQGQFFGIGAYLNQEEGQIEIQRVMPGLPAERAGIEDGDAILAIDGEKTAGLALDQAVRRIKGPKGTTVTLLLERKGAPRPLAIPVVRDLVKMITMRQLRQDGVGYIRMDEFNANTARDLFEAINGLQAPGPLKALVLDLRFNGGGLLDQAKTIGSFFLDPGKEVVSTVGANGKGDPTVNRARPLVTAPIVVLVSPGTASAAEIISGALQVNDRALVAGEPSYGKGSVQNVRDLRDGSRLKLTIQEYLLPGRVSIQDVGINPDLLLRRRAVREDGSVDLVDYTWQREGDSEFALENKRSYQHPTSLELRWLEPWQTRDERRAFSTAARDFRLDHEAQLAVDLLIDAAKAQDWDGAAQAAAKAGTLRQFLVERLAAPVAARAEAESARLAAALAKAPTPVAWGPAEAPAAGSLVLTWLGPAEVAAGSDAALRFAVENTAEREVGRLYAIVRADRRSPLWEDEVAVGAVPAKGRIESALRFAVPPRLPAGEERFALELHADGLADPVATVEVVLKVAAQPAPHLALAVHLSEPGGDGRLDPDEPGELVIQVRNDGAVPVGKALLWIHKDEDDRSPYVNLGASRLPIDVAVAPGAGETVRVPLDVRKELKRGSRAVLFPGGPVRINLNAHEVFPDGIDGVFRSQISVPLSVPVGEPMPDRELRQPLVALVGTVPDGDGRVRLRVAISDDNLRFVALFVGEDKIDLQPARALGSDKPGSFAYDPRIALKPGLNEVRILATDEDRISGGLALRLWGPQP
jgi:carboxyl-terminal processing protease